MLKENQLRQYAGWTPNSDMPRKYLHYFANESSNNLLKAYGVIPEDEQREDLLKPLTCTNCSEQNKVNSSICNSCGFILKYTAYEEIKDSEQQKDREIVSLKDQVDKMQEDFKHYNTQIGEFADHMKSYIEEQKTERKEQEEFRERERKRMEDTLDKVLPGWRKPYLRENSKQGLQKIKQIREGMKDKKDVWIESLDKG
jgi:regulator of replication initiation timing